MIKRISVISLLLTFVAALALPSGAVMAQEQIGEVIVDGLNNPQGVLVDPDGALWVVDSGFGGDTAIETMGMEGETITTTYGDTAQIVRVDPDGTATVVANLPSIDLIGDTAGGARLALLDGELYVTNGVYIANPEDPEDEPLDGMAVVYRVGEDGSLEEVAPTWRLETRMNPDDTVIESHPYGIAAGPEGKLWIADAGANTVIRVDPANGQIELLSTIAPLPGVFPNPLRDGEMLADPVPTGITFDDEGNALVALLSGAPFVPGSAKVVKVGSLGATSDYATGLTMLTDITRGPGGEVYGVQFAVFTDQGPTMNSGAIVRIVEGEGSYPVVEGLSFPTSLDFDEAGDAYVSINGAGPPGAGAVVKLSSDLFVEDMAEGEMDEEAEMADEEMAEEAEAADEEMAEGEMDEEAETADEEMAEEAEAADEEMAEGEMDEEAETADEEMAEEEMVLMDIVDTAAGNDDFSTLVAAVQAAGLAEALKGEGPFTVFAPTNAAFEALPDGTIEALLADPTGDLTDILLYHVLPGEAMSSDISDGLEVTTLQGDTVTFSIYGDTVMVNDATVIAADIEASNGVIHVIDSVLLPSADDAEMDEEAEMADEDMAEGEMADEAEMADEEMAEGEMAEEAEMADEDMAEGEMADGAEMADEEMAEGEMADSEMMDEGEMEAPETMPDTGADRTGTLSVTILVMSILLTVAGGLYVRRRTALQ